MEETQQNEPEASQVDQDELEEQDAELLPEREQLATIQPDGGLAPPAP